MQDTLQQGQYLVVSKAAYWRLDTNCLRFLLDVGHASCLGGTGSLVFGSPGRGDIVVFRAKDGGYSLIKRIVGLPGEKVEIRNGQVYINDQALHEPYVREPAHYQAPPEVVPPGAYFVLGDNRNNSSDSHVFGVVPAAEILGRAWVRYWPPTGWSARLSPNPTFQR